MFAVFIKEELDLVVLGRFGAMCGFWRVVFRHGGCGGSGCGASASSSPITCFSS
jgi:hypothetical protein